MTETTAAPAPVKKTAATRRPRRVKQPVTVTKVALGVQDLAGSLYRDAVKRVGGEKNLYRVRVLSPSRYEVDVTRS